MGRNNQPTPEELEFMNSIEFEPIVSKTKIKLNEQQISFQKEIIELIPSWIQIPTLTEEQLERVKNFSRDAAVVKFKEHTHDFEGEYKRIFNGKRAEHVLTNYLNQPAPNMEVGPSFRYAGPDIYINKVRYDIKASEINKSAMIFKKPKMAALVMIIDNRSKEDRFYICGIASIELQENNQDERLIFTAKNPDKTGLTIQGYKNLIRSKPQIATS